MKNGTKLKKFLFLLAALCLLASIPFTVYGEEEEIEEETEYIPEEYYDSVQTNELKGWPQGQAVQAAGAVVMDLDTNAFLYSKNAHEKMYPASITKIMTAMIVLEHTDMEEEITFSEIVYDIESDSSHVGIQPGEKMTIRQALNALMLESANDVANGLAEYVAGSVEAFADLMNEKALSLGCENTHFTNPHGLHNENHYTCAYDMALIAQAAYEMPEFRELVSTTLFYCPETNLTEEERYFVNHHQMIQEDSEYYTDWCKGGKNGFTSDAWNTLVTFGEKDGMRLVCVLLHENGADMAYRETTDLMNYGFDQFSRKQMEKEQAFPTFYQSMKLDYPGIVSWDFQADDLKQPIAVMTEQPIVTIPNSFTGDELTSVVNVSGRGGEISYSYEGWYVGKGSMALTPLVSSVSLPFEKKLDPASITVSANSEIEQTALTVFNQTKEVLSGAYEAVRGYVENNTLTVAGIGIVVLAVLVLVIVILFIRCTRESRIRRRRRQEERERLRMAEEIDRKTASEIEQELREAMEQERLRQERHAARMEAERLEEEKLRETEKIIEEINKK